MRNLLLACVFSLTGCGADESAICSPVLNELSALRSRLLSRCDVLRENAAILECLRAKAHPSYCERMFRNSTCVYVTSDGGAQ